MGQDLAARRAALGATLLRAQDPARLCALAADADGDGALSAAERATALERLAPDPAAPLAWERELAFGLAPLFDADGDGAIGPADVAALFTAADADASGALEAGELATALGRRDLDGLLDGVALAGADADADGAVSAAERDAAAGAGLATWLVRTAALQEDPNDFGPGTLVLTLRASADADHDGTLRGSDLALAWDKLDADGDGNLSSAELAPPRRRAQGTDWSVPDDGTVRIPLMPWQRSLEDALALSRASGKPLLVCVNTDGEAASDNLARGRYRDPAFIELVNGFVPVLASPDLHTKATHDDRGRRVEDPRFGRLVCPEHVEIEPLVYERYFAGQRVAPRHVGVAPDGTILFDLYLLNDLSVIDEALRKHGKFDDELPAVHASDVDALLASPDHAARQTLEERFVGAPRAERMALTARALDAARDVTQPELVRLALYDPEPDVRAAGAAAFAAQPVAALLDVAPRALLLGGDDAGWHARYAEALLALAARETSEGARVRARRLGRIVRALDAPVAGLDVERWRLALSGAAPSTLGSPSVAPGELEETLSRLESLRRERPEDPELDALVAQATLRLALHALREGGGNPAFFLQDAATAAERALARRPEDAVARATFARILKWQGEPERAADEAARALPALLGAAAAPETAELLEILGQGRTRALYAELGGEAEWPALQLHEALDAYALLLTHPDGTEAQAVQGAQLLENLELYARQERFLRAAIARFPLSGDLHGWLRWQVERDGGAEALMDLYDELPAPAGLEAAWIWFDGLARFVAAERFVASGAVARAIEAYEGSIQTFGDSIEEQPDFAPSANHYVALAWASTAKLHADAGRLDLALDELRRAFEANPACAEASDGLEQKPGDIARQVARAVRRSQDAALDADWQALAERYGLGG